MGVRGVRNAGPSRRGGRSWRRRSPSVSVCAWKFFDWVISDSESPYPELEGPVMDVSDSGECLAPPFPPPPLLLLPAPPSKLVEIVPPALVAPPPEVPGDL